jgi:pimeloyl-ACP methyl ester carboxylesterase
MPLRSWLFLRGLSREARHWLPFPERFERGVPGARVHLLDMPGGGTEWSREAPLSVGATMRDVRRRWLRLRDDHPGPWSVLGISLGGMVTLRWVGEHPADFEDAVVINTSAGDLSPPWGRMRFGVMGGVVRAMLSDDEVEREREILGFTTCLFEDRETLAVQWAEYHRERPMTRANVVRQLAAGARFRSPDRIAVPLLVLASTRDPLARAECGRRIAAKYGARFALHSSAGHDLPRDDAEWVIQQVAEFEACAAPEPPSPRAS